MSEPGGAAEESVRPEPAADVSRAAGSASAGAGRPGADLCLSAPGVGRGSEQ